MPNTEISITLYTYFGKQRTVSFDLCRFSHLCGNYQAASITTSVFFEFALRMVVSNLDDVPSIRIDHGGKCSDEAANQGISAHIVPGL